MVPSLLLFSWTPSSSLSIVGGALLLALWGLLAIWARLGRVVDARCPACMHRVAMLPEPTCPECGQDLAPGVVPADAWPPRMRPVFIGFLVLVVLFVVLVGFIWTVPLAYDVVRSAGVLEPMVKFRRSYDYGLQQDHQLRVRVSTEPFLAERDLKAEPVPTSVQLVLSDGKRWWSASRPGTLDPDWTDSAWSVRHGIEDFTPFLEELRGSFPPDSGAYLSELLHDQTRLLQLESIARHHRTANRRAPNTGLRPGARQLMARGSGTMNGVTRWEEGPKWLPWLLAGLPVLLVSGCIVVWMRRLVRRRFALVPFEEWVS